MGHCCGLNSTSQVQTKAFCCLLRWGNCAETRRRWISNRRKIVGVSNSGTLTSWGQLQVVSKRIWFHWETSWRGQERLSDVPKALGYLKDALSDPTMSKSEAKKTVAGYIREYEQYKKNVRTKSLTNWALEMGYAGRPKYRYPFGGRFWYP